jgi:hypothetical protein
MAMSSTYSNPALREDLLDIITNLSPTENQLATGLGKSKAQSSVHSWLVDVYDATTTTSTDKITVEGADYGAGDVVNPTRSTNYTQIIKQDWKVSGTEQAVSHAGMQSPKAYHMAKAMVHYKNKLEWSLVNGVAAAGNASTAREMGGIFDQITTNTIANAAVAFTETLFNDYFEQVWGTSAKAPDAVYVGATGKRVISGFTAGTTKFTKVEDKRLINTVDVYESDFGVVKLFLHRFVNDVLAAGSTGNILILREDTWFIAGLREPNNFDAPKAGDYEKGAILGETTLEGRFESANFAAKGYTNF